MTCEAGDIGLDDNERHIVPSVIAPRTGALRVDPYQRPGMDIYDLAIDLELALPAQKYVKFFMLAVLVQKRRFLTRCGAVKRNFHPGELEGFGHKQLGVQCGHIADLADCVMGTLTDITDLSHVIHLLSLRMGAILSVSDVADKRAAVSLT